MSEVKASRRSFLRSLVAAVPFWGVSKGRPTKTQLYVEESGVFGGDGPFCIGVLAVQNPGIHSQNLNQLRVRFGYRSQLLYRSTDKFKLRLAAAVCRYFFQTNDLTFSARVISKMGSLELSRGASEALYFDHYKKLLSRVAERSRGFSVMLVNHSRGGRDELLRKFLKDELPNVKGITVAHLRDSDFLQIANLFAGTVAEGDELESKVKRSFATTLRQMLRTDTLRDPSLQRSAKFTVQWVQTGSVGQPKEAFRNSVTGAGRPSDIAQTETKSQGHMSSILEFFNKYQSVAIWLEGIALVAIFILDFVERRDQRRERRQQHEETAAQLQAAQHQIDAMTISARAATDAALAAKKSADLAAALNRPFMGLSNVILQAGWNTRTWHIAFHLKNYGTLPAIKVECRAEFFTDNHSRSQKTDPASIEIFPSAEMVSIISFDMGELDRLAIHQETTRLFIKVLIPYNAEDGRHFSYSAEVSYAQQRFSIDNSTTHES